MYSDSEYQNINLLNLVIISEIMYTVRLQICVDLLHFLCIIIILLSEPIQMCLQCGLDLF